MSRADRRYAKATPDQVKQAHRLAWRNPRDGSKRSLRGIAAALEELGYTTASRRRFGLGQVQRLVAARATSARAGQVQGG